jgi:hypothetical protein
VALPTAREGSSTGTHKGYIFYLMTKTKHETENAGSKSDGFKILKLHSYQHKTQYYPENYTESFRSFVAGTRTFLCAEKLSSTAENKQGGIITKFTIAGK